MRISLEEMKQIAAGLLDVLEKEGINSNAELERRLDTKINLNWAYNDEVHISRGPSDRETFALVVDYVRHNIGVPIELRLNPELNYIQVILKCNGQIEEYSPFGLDKFKNVQQAKRLRPADFAVAMDELKRLTS